MKKQKPKIIVDDKKYRKIEKQLLKFMKGWILVGLFEGERHTGGIATVAEIGFFNEFGTINTPERSWMRSWFDANKKRIHKMFIKMTNLIKELKINAQTALKRIGEWTVGELKKSIIKLDSPANAFSTISKKGSSNPLIDTGQMLNSIRYEIGFGTPPERGV